MFDALAYPFMQRALAAGVLVGVMTSLLGVLVVLVLLAGRLVGRRPGWAFVVTSAAMATPVLAIGIVLGGDVAAAAAPPATLRLLSWVAVPIVPVLIGFQAMSWWVFRGRVDGRAPVYW